MEIGELAIGNKTETICFTWDSYDEMFDTDVWNVWHRLLPLPLSRPLRLYFTILIWNQSGGALNWSVWQYTTNLTTSTESVNSSASNTLDVIATQMAVGTRISKDYNMSVQVAVTSILIILIQLYYWFCDVLILSSKSSSQSWWWYCDTVILWYCDILI